MAGDHLPQTNKSTEGDDHKGYKDSHARRNGKQTGSLRIHAATGGNSQGSKAPGVGHRPSTSTHMGTSGRGDKGHVGKPGQYKGAAGKFTENPSAEWFERLGQGSSKT